MVRLWFKRMHPSNYGILKFMFGSAVVYKVLGLNYGEKSILRVFLDSMSLSNACQF